MTRRLLALSLTAAAILTLFTPFEPSSRANPQPGPTDAGADAAPPSAFDAEPIPTAKSPIPKTDEWRAAPRVSLTRNLSTCRAYRLREYMKIDCTDMTPAAIAEIAGSADGVQLFIASPPDAHKNGPDDPGSTFLSRTMEVVFPLRRGEGHMFQFLELGEGYDGPESAEVSLTLADHWVDGEAPVITLH